MKIPSLLFLHFIFFVHFNGSLSSNPDSIQVQSPEDNAQTYAEILEIQMGGRQRKMSANFERPRRPIVRIMKPVIINSRIYWREVGRENLDRFVDHYPRTIPARGVTEKTSIDLNRKRPFAGRPPPQVPQNNIVNAYGYRQTARTVGPPTVNRGIEQPLSNGNNRVPVTKPKKRISADSNLFAGIVNDFAFKLMENLNLESSFVISPLSIYIALSMCYLGADGRTKAQMERVLGMDDNAVHGQHLHQGIKDLMSLVLEETPGYKLFVANGMFLGRNYTSNPQFEEELKNYYNAEVKNVNFADAQSTVNAINNWVAGNTENMVTDIINSPPSPLTRLILLNAIFFKGTWKLQFPSNLTSNRKFHSLDGAEQEVPLMNMLDVKFPILQSDEHRQTFIKLPYEGDEVSMIIALPYGQREKPMPSISDRILCHVRDAMVEVKLDTVAIPKFRLEIRNSLRRPLLELGITDIFDRNVVDLSKLRKENDVFVSSIMHKAVVEVNEEGTAASASTSVSFVPLMSRNVTNFVADHPFSFYIVHEPSGLVLFYGKVFDFKTEPDAPNARRESTQYGHRLNPVTRG